MGLSLIHPFMRSLFLPCLKSVASMLGNGKVVNPGYREVTGFFQPWKRFAKNIALEKVRKQLF
jgi:hypothetical protein